MVMQLCRECGQPIEWGWDGQRWLPLEPVSTHQELPRTFVDEDGVLRADHRDRHSLHGSGVNVTRLAQKVPAEEAEPQPRRRRAG